MRIRMFLFMIVLSLMLSMPVNAAEVPADNTAHYSVTIDESKETNASNETRMLDPINITIYEIEYIMGTYKYYGAWRDGVSGGNNLDEQDLHLDQSLDTTRDISFTASVSGEYTPVNGPTIGAELGVTLGASRTYSFGSGTSVTVPKGSHWLIQYRPVYYKCQVIEKEYLEVYRDGFLLARHLVGTKTSYVDVFSYWDYTVVDDPI